MEIRQYHPTDEQGWIRCRVLSFLDTAYFDHVLKEKEVYDHQAIELVAVDHGQVVGLLDIEYETKERTVCSRGNGLGGMIWHIAVHPDYRRKGIANKLLQEGEKIAREKGLNRLEAWTRDDEWVNQWYVKNEFVKVDSYFHVYVGDKQESTDVIVSNMKGLYPVQTFAHYVGEDGESLKGKFNRVHECACFEKHL